MLRKPLIPHGLASRAAAIAAQQERPARSGTAAVRVGAVKALLASHRGQEVPGCGVWGRGQEGWGPGVCGQ
jgi:hypothetical protein